KLISRSCPQAPDVLRFMPLFEVTAKGRGIRPVVADGEAAGFFRSVRVWAEDRRRAETRAIAQVNSDWRKRRNPCAPTVLHCRDNRPGKASHIHLACQVE